MHLSEDEVLPFSLGQLGAERTAELESHVAGCHECHQHLQNLLHAKTVEANLSGGGIKTRPDGPISRNALPALMVRGSTLGRYVVIEKLGAGGMGEVFAAYDPQLDRKVAVKLLRGGALSLEEGKARLLREAQSMARLQHPNVIAVHDVGTFNDRVFIAMEFVPGETLSEWLRGTHTWKEVLRLFLMAGSGLAAAHRAGLVHRDFKPDNVLIGEDKRPRVLDFGLARQRAATPSPPEIDELMATRLNQGTQMPALTRDGAVMGTPGYMAPEQLAGLPTDERSDQFSFCVTLYESLYGRLPFGGATLKAHAAEMSAENVTPVPANTTVPTWVFEVVKRGLSADPNKRYPSMDALLQELRPREETSKRTVALGVSLAIVAAVAAAFGVWTNQRLKVCGGSERRLATVWNPTEKTKLQTAFAATRVTYAPEVWKNVERTLDAWALDWVNGMRDACEAAKIRAVDSEDLYELKVQCLEGRLQRFRALTNLFEAADREVVSNASTAARSLDAVATCFDADSLQRRNLNDVSERKVDAEFRPKFDEARALFSAGKYSQGAALLQQSLRPDLPARTMAEAQLLLARLRLRAADSKGAAQANLVAAEQALRSGDSALQAMAFSRLYANEGFDEHASDAELWSRLAHAAAARVSSNWEVEAELAANDAVVALEKKNFVPALTDLQRKLRLQEEHLGPEHPDVAETLNNIGVALTYLGRLDGAIEQYERSLKIHIAVEGEHHPSTATAEHNLGVALRRLGRHEEARRKLATALVIRSEVLGAEHPDTLNTAQALARVDIALGDMDGAMQLLQQVLEVRQKTNGPRSKEVAQIEDTLAGLYRERGDWKEARTTAEHSIAMFRETVHPNSPLLASALMTLGEIRTHDGAWAEARKAYDEALKIRKEVWGSGSAEWAAVQTALGHWAWAQNKLDEAEAAYRAALDVRSRFQSSPEAVAELHWSLGRLFIARNQPAQAIDELNKASEQPMATIEPELRASIAFELAKARFLSEPLAHDDSVAKMLAALPRLSSSERAVAQSWLTKAGVAVQGTDAGQ